MAVVPVVVFLLQKAHLPLLLLRPVTEVATVSPPAVTTTTTMVMATNRNAHHAHSTVLLMLHHLRQMRWCPRV